MKSVIRTSLLLGLFTVFGVVVLHKNKPRLSTKPPHVRENGYKINHSSIERTKWFTVLISNEGFGGVGRGTGIIIDPTHVLTCAHMVEDRDDDIWIFPYSRNGTPLFVDKGHPVFVSRGKDLAVLELDIPLYGGPVPTFQPEVEDGQPITIIGNTLGSMKWFVSYGVISGSYKNYILTDGLVKGGNSGGPWINEAGEVLGISDWGLQKGGQDVGISGAVSAKTIQEFLKSWKNPSLFDMILNG
jgi:S1-C subfamily serine protease